MDANRKLDVNEMNLSLNGCGYVGIYLVGVCSCIKQYYPQVLRGKISGGSVGALVACAFMCDVPIEVSTKYIFNVSMQVRNGILGPMSPDLNIIKVLYEKMDEMLPDDAHLHCDGRLYVSVTKFDTGENVLLNNFSSKAELLQALMCSCFIPVYCGYQPPLFRGVAYVDAALSNNSPCLDSGTISVAPFAGNSDICPESDGTILKSFNLSNTSIGLSVKNMYTLFRVLFPGSPESQKEYCQKGYNDALRFLRDNNMIPCPNCVADVEKRVHTNCKPPDYPMPKGMTREIDLAIIKYRKKLGYRLLQYRSMKFLYYMNMPSIMTAKVGYVALSAVLQRVQSKAGACVEDVWSYILEVLKEILNRRNNRLQSSPPPQSSGTEDSANESERAAYETTSSDENANECESILCSNGNAGRSEDLCETNPELIMDIKVDVPQTSSNDYSYKVNLPLCESKTETQGPGMIKACV